jgi:hypothetical protein
MKIQGLFSVDTFVKVNDINEVTSQAIYQSTETFNPKGIFSEEIFGQTPEERSYRCGYIKLPCHVFNPHIATTIIKRSGGIIRKMAYGECRCNLVNGQLIAAEDGKYMGFKDLYNIWEDIDIKKTLNTTVQDTLDILTKTPKKDLFNDKVVVLPPGFREIGKKNGKIVKSELNTLYMQLIGYKSVAVYAGQRPNDIHAKIQDALINIYTFIKTRTSGKNGFFQQKLLSKTTLWTGINVISAPKYNTSNPEIGIFRTGYPLHTLVSLFHPLVKFAMKQFLSYDNIHMIHPNKDEVKSNNLVNIYDDKMIEDLIKIYKKNPGSRMKVLYLDPENTKPMIFQAYDKKNNQTIERPLTLTDVIYMCVYSVVVKANRTVYTVRYPIGDYLGAFFTKAHILSTNYTMEVEFQGESYPSYPIVDPTLPRSRIATSYADTITPANSRLKVLGGDYDGDTVKSIGIWSDEANAKAEKLMYSKIYNITPQGTTVYKIEIECLNGLYGLTKMPKKAA